MQLYDYLRVFGGSFLRAGDPAALLNPPAIAPSSCRSPKASSSTRTVLSKRVAINVGLMLVVAMVAGNVLLSFFGISLSIVRVGGGMLVIASAWRLVNSPDADTERGAAGRIVHPGMAKARAFYPLTFPISCGPGSIAAAITVGVLRDQNHALSLVRLAGSIPGIIVVSVTLYICSASRRRCCTGWATMAPPCSCVCRPSSCCAWACRSSGKRARTDGRRAAAGHATNSGSRLGSGHGPEGPQAPARPARRGSTNPYYKIH